ncbi:MAG: hypothetical protein V4719_28375 [Planctomycetota bacterium]
MAELKIKNVKTLTRWYQERAIPEPQIELHPCGIGRIACWPDWVLDHGRVVKRLLGEGQTLKDIAGTFGTNWTAISARYRKYNFKRASEIVDRQQLLLSICDSIYAGVAKHLGDIKRRLDTTSFPPITIQIVSQALALIDSGHNPVLILSAEQTIAVPDFLISLHLSKHFQARDPFLVVPLFAIVMEHEAAIKMVKKPTTHPVDMVTTSEKGGVQKAVIVGADWEFHLQEKA